MRQVNLSVCDTSIDLKYNKLFCDGASNNIIKDMSIYFLKAIF